MKLSNIHVVLVNPIYPGNVGAIARSAKNYGVASIKIVGDIDVLCMDAKKMALYGFDLLENASRYNSLKEALATTTLVIGTVQQSRFNRTAPKPTWDIVECLSDRLSTENAAIVFGREDNGMTREEIDLCHHLATIPTPDNMSFNLAHSVTVFLYEISRALSSTKKKSVAEKPTQTELEECFSLFAKAMKQVRFFKGTQEASAMNIFRDIAYKAQIDANDLPMIKAVFYKIISTVDFWKNENSFPASTKE